MVSLLEHLKCEVVEGPREPLGELPVLVGVAESAEREVDRALEPTQRLPIEVVSLERAHERADAGRALRHPGRRRAGRRGRRLETGAKLQPHECVHELVRRQLLELLEFSPHSPLGVADVPVARPGGLEQGKAQQSIGTPRSRRERGCAAARVADEVEALPAPRIGLTNDAGDLVVEGVVDRRLVARIHLEILRDRIDVRPECVDQRAVGEVGGKDGARKQDHTADGSSFRARTSSTKESTTGCAGLMR